MAITDTFRIDYNDNMRKGLGPLPQGLGRGHWFRDEDAWILPDFVTDQGLEFLQKKAAALLGKYGLRKDMVMLQSGGTPRNMRVVPGTAINKDPEIVAMYTDPLLLDFLSETIRKKVLPYPDPLENIVITSLEQVGDVHGRHRDVPPLALIMCLESPPQENGKRFDVVTSSGEVWQTVEGTDDGGGFAAYTDVDGDLEIICTKPGDAYILRSDLWEHEVLPLSRLGTVRTILNFTYGIEGIEGVQDGSALDLFT